MHKPLPILRKGKAPVNYKPVTLHCSAFRFCVFRVMLLGSRGPPVEKKGEKSSSALAPTTIFGHFKLKLETEFKGRTVTSLFINKSPTRSRKAFLLLKGLQCWTITHSEPKPNL